MEYLLFEHFYGMLRTIGCKFFIYNKRPVIRVEELDIDRKQLFGSACRICGFEISGPCFISPHAELGFFDHEPLLVMDENGHFMEEVKEEKDVFFHEPCFMMEKYGSLMEGVGEEFCFSMPKYKWYQRGPKRILLEKCNELVSTSKDDNSYKLCPETGCLKLLYWSFDFSHEHPFLFIEELEEDDDKREAVCFGCQKPLNGPGFKCCGCNLHIHKSCIFPNEIQLSFLPFQTLLFHSRHMHPLILMERPYKKEDNKLDTCFVCKEPELGPCYICSQCNFFLHKSCGELTREMDHPLHPHHSISLREPSVRNRNCDACRKDFHGCFSYHCNKCDISLDIKCISRWLVNTDDCDQHAFVPIQDQIQFTCKVCGEDGKDVAYLCSICRLLIHYKCALSLPPRAIKILRHDHHLNLTYSLHKTKESDDTICKVCYGKVNTQHAVYCCKECTYAAHLECARGSKDRNDDSNKIVQSSINEYVGYEEINILAEDGRACLRGIKHFCHEHNLSFFNDEVITDDKVCEGCMHFISGRPFYGCAQCNYFLHEECAKLPIKKRHVTHRHDFTLSQSPSNNGLFCCNACGQYRHGFVYKCDTCTDYFMDILCFWIAEQYAHEGHQHSLYLAHGRSGKTCNACGRRQQDAALVCRPCDFALCLECATRPRTIRYEYDRHPLVLSYSVEDDSGEYYCFICEKERDSSHWFYYCAECDFSAHTVCILGKYPYIKFGSTYTNDAHRHPLTFVRKMSVSSAPCDMCHRPFRGVAVECTSCEVSHSGWGGRCKLRVHPWGDCFKSLRDEKYSYLGFVE